MLVEPLRTKCLCDKLSSFAILARLNPDMVSVSRTTRSRRAGCVCVCVGGGGGVGLGMHPLFSLSKGVIVVTYQQISLLRLLFLLLVAMVSWRKGRSWR